MANTFESSDPSSSQEIEEAFLEAISASPVDNATRYVYADWLEEQLDIRAEYLRLACQWSELSVTDPAREACQRRMRELVVRITPAWLSQVVDVFPMNCPASQYNGETGRHQCPQRWLMLKPTRTPEIRECGACQRRVHFCSTYRNVELAVETGQPVAIEPSLDSTAYRNRCPFDPVIAEAAKRDAKRLAADTDDSASELATSLADIGIPRTTSSVLRTPSSGGKTTLSWLRRLLSWGRQ
jgi:uncharacterized protein (TIGR02996 family)